MEKETTMEERQAEQVHAVCRRGISAGFDQADDELYCLKCFEELKHHLPIDGPGEGTRCGGEYQWVTKADLESRRAKCRRCEKAISIEPILKI
jgi:hypothetical protein